MKDSEERKTQKRESSEPFVSEFIHALQRDQNLSLTRRLEIPQFDGENTESWVLRVEQYFELGEFTEEQKLKAVRLCFDGEALMWYRWERGRNPFTCWEQMKERILEQFAESQDTTAGERLLTLRQVGTVKDYIRDFMSQVTNAPEIPESVLELAFMIGLKHKIRAGVKMFEPRTLKKMMSLAKTVEEWSSTEIESEKGVSGETPKHSKLVNDKGSSGSSSFSKPNPFRPKVQTQSNQAPTTTSRGQPNPNQASTSHGRLKPPFCRLTPAEYAKWKREGLCYKCDEKYVYPHVCSRKELMVLLVHENGTETEILDEPIERQEVDEGEVTEVAELSVNSVVALSSPHTINLRGSINGVGVVVLIDSGATHNFI